MILSVSLFLYDDKYYYANFCEMLEDCIEIYKDDIVDDIFPNTDRLKYDIWSRLSMMEFNLETIRRRYKHGRAIVKRIKNGISEYGIVLTYVALDDDGKTSVIRYVYNYYTKSVTCHPNDKSVYLTKIEI